METISIIIPLYNKENYIIQCIDSIISQSYKYFEIIVIDDGSTDEGINKVKLYKDYRIKLISKKNGGVSSARNEGIKNANGNWVLFLDADDKLEKNALQSFIDSINIYPNVKIFISNFWEISGNKKHPYSNWRKKKLIETPLKEIWYRNIYARPGNTLIHKDVFTSYGGYVNGMKYNEDYEFSLRLLSYYKIVYIPEFTMSYIKNENSASNKIQAIEYDYAHMIQSLSYNSIYQKLLYFSIAYFSGYKRRKGTFMEKEGLENLKKCFPNSFKYIYIYYAFIRYIKQILKL